MAIPAATPALMDRVEPNCAIDTVVAAKARAAVVKPSDSEPNNSKAFRGSFAVSTGTEPGMLSTATMISPDAAADAASEEISTWWCTC